MIFTNSKFLSGEGKIAGGRMALVWAVIIAGVLWLCGYGSGFGARGVGGGCGLGRGIWGAWGWFIIL